MKEQLPAGLGEWQIAAFVEHDEVEPGQVIGEPSLPAGTGLAFQPVHEIDHGVKASSRATADAGPCEGYGEMAFARAGAADQHGVALLGDELAARQVADQSLH